jgi:hypothetical protein
MTTRTLRRALPPVAAGALLALAAATAQGAGSATAVCKGSDTQCDATFSLAGGASDKTLTVRLPAAGMRRIAVNATPAHVQGAYSLTNGRLGSGGTTYTATLDAVQSIPRGARLILTFGHPSAVLSCGNIPNGVSYLSIAQLGSVRPGSFGCDMARTLGRAWASNFRAHRSTEQVTAAGITFACKLVPRLPQNFRCDGGNLRVRFSGPTG